MGEKGVGEGEGKIAKIAMIANIAEIEKDFVREGAEKAIDQKLRVYDKRRSGGDMDELTRGNENEIEEPEIQPRHHTDPRADCNIEGFWYAKEEMEQVQRQERAATGRLHEKAA